MSSAPSGARNAEPIPARRSKIVLKQGPEAAASRPQKDGEESQGRHDHRHHEALGHPVGPRPGAQARGAAPSGVPRPAQGAQPGRADQGARRGGRALVRAARRQGHLRRAGHHAKPDITLSFKNAAIGAALLTPPINWLDQINALKDFILVGRRARGPHQLVGADHDGEPDRRLEVRHPARRRHHALLQHDQRRPGVRPRQGRQDRAHDADRFRRRPIRSRGPSRRAASNFTPPRKTTLAPHGQNAKSIVYSPDRLLYPMKRVDFDPNGARNPRQPRQVGLRAHLVGRGARPRRRRDQALQARRTARARSRPRTARTTPGATSATTSRRCFRFPTRSA